MPTGMVQMWVFTETRDIIKALAAEAGVTISDMVRSRFEDAAVDAKGYTVEKAKDAKILAGDFKETGKGKPKVAKEDFTYEGKVYQFRRLDMTEKDFDFWKAKKVEDVTWCHAYCDWFMKKYKREWKADMEWEEYNHG